MDGIWGWTKNYMCTVDIPIDASLSSDLHAIKIGFRSDIGLAVTMLPAIA